MIEIKHAAQMALDALTDARLFNYSLKHQETDELIEILRSALKRNDERQLTHAEGCWSWGPQHYMCCYNEVGRLRGWKK